MVIEKGIPLPAKNTGKKRNTMIVGTLVQMEHGDSVLFTDSKDASLFRSTGVVYIRRGKLKPNSKLVQRKVENGVRVWLVEDKNEPKTSTTSAT